jgi:hypothetical protein
LIMSGSNVETVTTTVSASESVPTVAKASDGVAYFVFIFIPRSVRLRMGGRWGRMANYLLPIAICHCYASVNTEQLPWLLGLAAAWGYGGHANFVRILKLSLQKAPLSLSAGIDVE